MSDFQEPQNFCGRRIEYPSFANNVRVLFPALRDPNIILPPPQTPHPNAPPGVNIRPSPCGMYYSSRDPRKMSSDCKQCIYNEYDITRIPGPDEDITAYDCICDLKKDFSPDDFCEYAKCVQEQHSQPVQSCARPFYAIFNQDDIRDENYIPPFTYEQIDYCMQRNQ